MPIHDGNSVTVGDICFSCGRYHAKECPYKNHLKNSSLEFKADISNKCSYYIAMDEDIVIFSDSEKNIKIADIDEKKINILLYRRINAMSEKEMKKTNSYWRNYYSKEYADKMTDDTNTSKKQTKCEEPKRKNVFDDKFKTKDSKNEK